MTSKPPYEMAASGHSDSADTELEDLSDQLTVDASQDVTVEAAEEATLEIGEEETLNTLTPPPISFATPPPSRRAPTLMGLPLPSLPLPGVTAAASHPLDSDDDEVTVMARPSVTDDEEEATKVEPAETALHAAASKDDDELTTALSAQASVERERALRKSLPPSLDLPLPGYGGDTDSEFEDPEDDDGISLASDTPAISVDDDAIATSSHSADSEEPSSELEAVLAPRRPTAVLGSLGSLGSSPFGGSPVLARPDAFGAARLPTPSPGFGFSLPSPNQAPAPSSSPFSARLAPAGSPYGARVTSSMPALQIPAPSGVAATTAGTSSGFFMRRAQMPVAAVAIFVVAAFIFGMVAGVKLGRGSSTLATAQSTPPPAPVVIQPVATPPAPVAAETPPAAAAVPTTPPPSPSAAAPTPPAPAAAAPVADDSAVVAPEPPRPAIKRARPAVRKPTTVAMDGAPAPKVAATPKSAAAPKPAAGPKTAKTGKTGKAKAWVDPFAE